MIQYIIGGLIGYIAAEFIRENEVNAEIKEEKISEPVDIDKVISEIKELKTPESVKEKYEDNESYNRHGLNNLMLAILFGSKKDIDKEKEIYLHNQRVGYSEKDMDQETYDKLIKQYEKYTETDKE